MTSIIGNPYRTLKPYSGSYYSDNRLKRDALILPFKKTASANTDHSNLKQKNPGKLK